MFYRLKTIQYATASGRPLAGKQLFATKRRRLDVPSDGNDGNGNDVVDDKQTNAGDLSERRMEDVEEAIRETLARVGLSATLGFRL